MTEPKKFIIILFFIFACIYLSTIGMGSLQTWDEGLTAERSREMSLNKHYLTPHLNFSPDFNKPPLYYIITSFAFRIFGQNEFSVRFLSSISAFLCIIFVFQITYKITDNTFSPALASLFLLFNPHWVNCTKSGLLDSGFLLGVIGGIYFFISGFRSARNIIYSALFISICCLIKGPLTFFAVIFLMTQILNEDNKKLYLRQVFILCLLSLAIITPYYLYQYLKWNEAFISTYVSRNLFDRFTEPIQGHSRETFFYFKEWISESLNSFLIFIIAVFLYLKNKKHFPGKYQSFLLFPVLVLLLINIAASKRSLYILPVYPFIAIFSGIIISESLGKLRSERRRNLITLIIVLYFLIFILKFNIIQDPNKYLKQTAIYLKNNNTPDKQVFVINEPVQLILFYSSSKTPVCFLNIKKIKNNEPNFSPDSKIILRKDDQKEFFELFESSSFEKNYENKKFVILSKKKSVNFLNLLLQKIQISILDFHN